ncbi:MAG TPA: hypothetical protein PK759_03225 [Spirochaetales bacterium]|nr:hypothetical protein [Spirochaetales bacterium]HPS14793.1 hypothetical protein [Spirochaetales bacterium]
MGEIITSVAQWFDSLPSVIRAVFVFLVGWGVAKLLKTIIPAFLVWLKFDVLAERIGFKEFLRKGDAQYVPSKLIGVILYWTVFLLTLARAAALLDSRVSASISLWLAGAIPTILATIITAVIGVFVVKFLSNFVRTIMNNAGLASATMVQSFIRVLGYTIVIIMVIGQLGFESVVNIILLLLVGSIALGVAIAIGLGCKDIARRYVEDFLQSMRERERASHRTDLEG